MNLTARILGTHAVDRLSAISQEHVLVAGSDKLTRSDLAGVDCYNFVAARYLTQALHDIGVENLKDVYERVPPRELARPHVGVITLAVLGAAFEHKRIGGDNPLENYVKKHQDKLVTFDTIKLREERAERQAKKDAKRKKRARQQKAHELRVERFTDRVTA